jgi:hypothetical protein
MIQNSEMTRWTRPTNPEFYALHKDAIGFYTTIAAIAQGVWLIFSVKPLSKLLIGSLDWLPENYAYFLSVGVLLFLHWQLHKLLAYIAFNWLDDDPNTNSSFVHYALAFVITGGMLTLDIQGTTAFFREGDKFEELANKNDGKKNVEAATRQARYDQDNATLAKSEKAEMSAVEKRFAPSIAATKNRRTFDSWDIAKRKKDLTAIEAKRDAEIAAIETAYANQYKTLLAAKNSDLAEIGSQHTNRHQRITAADDDNAAKSNRNGWVISCICLVVLLGCTYQITDLRVRSGQQPVARITIADETGSFGSKLHDAVTDIGQRFGHIIVYKLHNALAVKELDQLDGSYQIKGRTQSAASTPPPTTPPLSNNNPTTPPTGGGGNGGGGNNPPQSPTAPPTGGNAQAAPIVRQSDIAVAEKKPKFAKFSTLPENTRVNISLDLSRDFQLSYVDMERILYQIDPECSVVNDTMEFIQTEHFGELGMAVGNLKNAQKAAFENSPTPPVVEEKTTAPIVPQTEAQNGVPHQTPSVPHQNGEIVYSELDNTLNLLRSKLLKESESQFTNGKADKESVRNRIVKILDEAGRALSMKSAKCNPSVLRGFSKAAADKLALMEKYECDGYAEELELWHIVDGRLDKEVDNG